MRLPEPDAAPRTAQQLADCSSSVHVQQVLPTGPAERLPEPDVDSEALSGALTVLVNISPAERDLSMLEEVMDSISVFPGMRQCQQLLVLDAIRDTRKKKSNVTEEEAADYEAFKQRVRELVKNSASAVFGAQLIELGKVHGFGPALQEGMKLVKTKFVVVVQHDWAFIRPGIDLRKATQTMQQLSPVHYIAEPSSPIPIFLAHSRCGQRAGESSAIEATASRLPSLQAVARHLTARHLTARPAAAAAPSTAGKAQEQRSRVVSAASSAETAEAAAIPTAAPLVICITGCSSGLGHALALEFSRLGHTVVGCARRRHRIEAMRKEFGARGAPHFFDVLDISDAGAVEAFAQRIKKERGLHVDVLINNAGVEGAGGMPWDTETAKFDQVQ
jgi:hypothetical protein